MSTKSVVKHERTDEYEDLVTALRCSTLIVQELFQNSNAKINQFYHSNLSGKTRISIIWETPIESISDRSEHDIPGMGNS